MPDESTYIYDVTAKRTKDFFEYVSETSEPITVKLPSSLYNVDNNSCYLYTTQGNLHVVTSETNTIEIYSLQGTIVAKGTIHSGENIFGLPQGIYVVRVGNNVYKALVK